MEATCWPLFPSWSFIRAIKSEGFCGACFSLRGLVLAKTKPRKRKHAPLIFSVRIPSVQSIFSELRFKDDLGEGGVAVMRDGDGDIFHAEAVGDGARRAGQFQRGLAAWFADDFDVDPAHAARPACPEGFHRGFLGGKAAGEAFGAVAVLLAVAYFRRGEEALEQRAAAAGNGRLDAVDFRDVHSQADDHSRSQWNRLQPVRFSLWGSALASITPTG